MREQLKLLEELQRHDVRVQELEAILKSLPQRLAAAESAIAELERALDSERAERADNDAFRRAQDEGQREIEQSIVRAKAKLAQVRNLKESNAVQREIDAARKQMDSREEEVAKLIQAMELQRKRILEHEEKLAADREEVARQRAAMSSRLDEINGQLSEVRVARAAAAKHLRADILKRYGTIRVKRGLAVVAVSHGTCSGCNMNIPPQLYNVLQRGTSLEVCPNCNRIIYWGKLLEERDS